MSQSTQTECYECGTKTSLTELNMNTNSTFFNEPIGFYGSYSDCNYTQNAIDEFGLIYNGNLSKNLWKYFKLKCPQRYEINR